MRYSLAVVALFLALATADRIHQAPKKVRLRDLTAITLHADKQTSARRSSPISQLECVGGDACHDFQPKVVRVSVNNETAKTKTCLRYFLKIYDRSADRPILWLTHGNFQCQNDGFDGYDVQWTCNANMPDNIEFGDIEVSCEGFDFPEDPFVLVNSCGLEYSLYYKNKAKKVVSNDDERYFPKSRPGRKYPVSYLPVTALNVCFNVFHI